jgi:hypothetical protein
VAFSQRIRDTKNYIFGEETRSRKKEKNPFLPSGHKVFLSLGQFSRAKDHPQLIFQPGEIGLFHLFKKQVGKAKGS